MNELLNSLTARIGHLSGRASGIRSKLKDTEQQHNNTALNVNLNERTAAIGQAIINYAQGKTLGVMEDITTTALQTMFGDDIKSVWRMSEADKKPQIEVLVETDGGLGDPLRTCGNSVSAVLSGIIRRAFLLMTPQEHTLFADEPLYGIDSEKITQMASVDRDIVDETGIQYIIVTHEGAGSYKNVAEVTINVSRGIEGSDIDEERN